ncbi:MAG: MBL fold metallo-hydrolase [Methanosarcinales archaeon]|nr:MBL fold metallo-hydrolase [Methanosarcinales archaeon]
MARSIWRTVHGPIARRGASPQNIISPRNLCLPLLPAAFLIKPGSLVRDQVGNILDARSSSTLIISDVKIVVDTGLCGEGKLIREGVAKWGLCPEDIDLVVNTHGHEDHTGNNHLFVSARTLGPGERREGHRIAEGVWIMETPGHTLDSVSVVCQSERTVIVAGDALPTKNNFSKRVPPRLHVDRDLAIRSMERIIETAEIVIPGHDRPFALDGGSHPSSLE